MPRQVRAVVVDPGVPGRLAIKPVELRDPDRDEVAVRVTAISLNRGETRRAVQQAETGWRPGWDFVGVIETTAADGSGLRPGTRVVGILPSGAWAERVNCRSHAVAALPDAVGDVEAATLPVAGLTALHALRQGGLLLGRKVLVDGASGGVGHLACQLATAAGCLSLGPCTPRGISRRGCRVVRGTGRAWPRPRRGQAIWAVLADLGFARRTGARCGSEDAAAGRHRRNVRRVRRGSGDNRKPRLFCDRRDPAIWAHSVPRADERRARRHRLGAARKSDRRKKSCIRKWRSRHRGAISARLLASLSIVNSPARQSCTFAERFGFSDCTGSGQ